MSKFELGELVIANEVDRPCARLICEVVNTEPYILQYLDKSLNYTIYGDPERMLRLTDLRIRPVPTDLLGICTIEVYGVPTAKYLTGESRYWQPESPERLEIDTTNRMTSWIAGYAAVYYFKYFSQVEGADDLMNYILPFIRDIHNLSYSSLDEIRQKADNIKAWITYERSR